MDAAFLRGHVVFLTRHSRFFDVSPNVRQGSYSCGISQLEFLNWSTPLTGPIGLDEIPQPNREANPMTTETSAASESFVEFRCSRCYQIRHEAIEQMGMEVSCPFCANQQSVPEVSPEQFLAAEDVLSSMGQLTAEQGQFNEHKLSKQEINKIAKQRAAERAPKATDYLGVGSYADVMTRVFAHILDNLASVAAIVFSVGLGFALSKAGICPTPDEAFGHGGSPEDVEPIFFVAYGGLAVMINFLFWIMIAKTGQSPGKMAMGIKIVNDAGKPPGFLRGVVLRMWIAQLLMNIIPLGGILNYGLAFMYDPPRCGHDHLAGTHVVNA